VVGHTHPDSCKSVSDKKMNEAFHILSKYRLALDLDFELPKHKRLTPVEMLQMAERKKRGKQEQREKAQAERKGKKQGASPSRPSRHLGKAAE
jgi:hypothetical protein